MDDISQFESTASSTPMFTPLWRIAAIQARHDLGQVSESKEAPTAHSPPMPRAERNRKTRSCHQVCAKNDRPVNSAYVSTVRERARLRPSRSPIRPKNPPPSAQPRRKPPWMIEA